MSALELLNSSNIEEGKPYYGFSKLAIGNHEIIKFRVVKNKQYIASNAKTGLKHAILVELKDQVLFLPPHFSRKFIGEDGDVCTAKVDELNADTDKTFLYFGGARANRYVDLRFNINFLFTLTNRFIFSDLGLSGLGRLLKLKRSDIVSTWRWSLK